MCVVCATEHTHAHTPTPAAVCVPRSVVPAQSSALPPVLLSSSRQPIAAPAHWFEEVR